MTEWTLRNEDMLYALVKRHRELLPIVKWWVGYVMARQARIEREARA